jgi:hypothetical protein
MIENEHEATLLRLMQGEGAVLAVQDTTGLNYSGRRVEGLGVLEDNRTSGYFAHTTLAVSTNGVPQGILHQQVWSRPRNNKLKDEGHKRLPIEEKESNKWLVGLKNSLDERLQRDMITVCDREGDVYELFQTAHTHEAQFIVRAVRDRRTQPGELLETAIAKTAVAGRMTVAIARRPQEETQAVTLALRFTTLTLLPPMNRPQTPDFMPLTPQTVQVVEALEIEPPDAKPAIRWLLLTNCEVSTLQQAQTILRYYSYRWLVERFHFVLKSGLSIEDSQLERLPALHNFLALCSGVAWRLLWMIYQARLTPDVSCEELFAPPEWQALHAYMTHSTQPPPQPPSLRQTVRWIGKLGGFLGRKHDGEPGVKVLWRGLSRLQDIVDTWKLFQSLPLKDVGNG